MAVGIGQRQPGAGSEHPVNADRTAQQRSSLALAGRQRYDSDVCFCCAPPRGDAGLRSRRRRIFGDRTIVFARNLGQRTERIAAVVARAGEGDDSGAGRSDAAQALRDGGARIAHQLDRTDASDRLGVGGTHLLGRQDVDHDSKITTAAATSRRVRYGQVDRSHAAQLDQPLRVTEELDRGFAAALVPHADAPPRNPVAESFARRLLRGEEASEPFGPVAFAHRVRHLALGIDLSREPCKFALPEAVARDVCHVETDADDHRVDFDATDAGHLDFVREVRRSRWIRIFESCRSIPLTRDS